jgi:hypothetical protein
MKDKEGAMKAIDLRLRGFFRVRAGRHSQSPLADLIEVRYKSQKEETVHAIQS